MTTYYFWFFLFAIFGYFIVTDNSVARAFHMLVQLLNFQYQKMKWWILHDPKNPIVKYLIWRRSMKLAKELQEELKLNNK